MRAELSWLENPEVFRVNRLDAHSDHHFYETEQDALEGRETLRQSLNGTWKFAWSKCPGQRPADFYEETASLEGFGTIEVPGHMETQGYDRIQYINTMYPWDGHDFLKPGQIDWNHDPVGSYVREFDLEPALVGKRVAISFQGAEQAVYVWLNGVFIGYAEDTFTPSDFDLTSAIREKNNRLCVEVYKRSSAAWIEDQDFFRFSGLFREVFLYAKPEAHVEDLWAKAGLKEDNETGTLDVELRLSSEKAPEDLRIFWSLQETEPAQWKRGLAPQGRNYAAGFAGKEICSGALHYAGGISGCFAGSEEKKPALANGESGSVQLWKMDGTQIAQVRKWQPGAPQLYQLWIRVQSADGRLLETVPYRVGFRRFEIKDRVMLLNGERLIINGVNRHEWNARRGRAVTRENMEEDIDIFTRNNINAVRTCHYPDQSLWYQLCDENGICMMDEANLESHGSWAKLAVVDPEGNVPGNRPDWEACVVDRAASMVERDKNHPAILWWSCGNESYAGTGILAMSQYYHKKDPSRVVHYEGVSWNREYDQISDVESRMYATPDMVREYFETDGKKPYLLCEYMHDMGNSIGGMESYIRLLDEFPGYQGGFIWDYADQAIYHKNHRGEDVLGYGGDFLDRVTDYAFSGNGIVFADRTEKPAMQDVRHWYAPKAQREAFEAEQQEKREAAQKRLAEEMAALDVKNASAEKGLSAVHGDANYGVRGDGFEIIFSVTEGGPVSIVYNGTEYLYRAPKPALWRASTENDKGNSFRAKSSVWMAADVFSLCTGCEVTEYAKSFANTGDTKKEATGADEGCAAEKCTARKYDIQDAAHRAPAAADLEKVSLTYTYEFPSAPGAKTEITYTVDRAGRIHTEVVYHGAKGLPELPEFGLRLLMPGKAESYTWEGLSGETYPDRKKGGTFGVHTGTPEAAHYLVPQECGNHADTCQAQIGDLRIVMDGEPFHLSVLPYTPEELENATHRDELPDTGRTVVSILGRMRGVGGIDSWGSDVEPPYRIPADQDIKYAFYLMK